MSNCPARRHRLVKAVVLLSALLGACSERPSAPAVEAMRATPGGGVRRESIQSTAAPASLDWQQAARSLIGANNLAPRPAARVLAALGVAEYRAVIAADQDHPNDGRSEFEERRGAVAAASQTVLAFFFPSATTTLQQVYDGQSDAHPWFARGASIGQAVGAAIVTRTMNDGFTRPFP